MKIATPVIWLGGAAVMFTVALAVNSFDLVLVSMVPGGVGLGTLLFGLKRRWSSEHAIRDEERIQQIEDRLRLTEDELASAARELAALREQRDFDVQLQHRRLNG